MSTKQQEPADQEPPRRRIRLAWLWTNPIARGIGIAIGAGAVVFFVIKIPQWKDEYDARKFTEWKANDKAIAGAVVVAHDSSVAAQQQYKPIKNDWLTLRSRPDVQASPVARTVVAGADKTITAAEKRATAAETEAKLLHDRVNSLENKPEEPTPRVAWMGDLGYGANCRSKAIADPAIECRAGVVAKAAVQYRVAGPIHLKLEGGYGAMKGAPTPEWSVAATAHVEFR